MCFSEGEGITMVDKFYGKNFNIYKFKIEMFLATKDLSNIVGGSETPPPFTTNNNKAYD